MPSQHTLLSITKCCCYATTYGEHSLASVVPTGLSLQKRIGIYTLEAFSQTLVPSRQGKIALNNVITCYEHSEKAHEESAQDWRETWC